MKTVKKIKIDNLEVVLTKDKHNNYYVSTFKGGKPVIQTFTPMNKEKALSFFESCLS